MVEGISDVGVAIEQSKWTKQYTIVVPPLLHGTNIRKCIKLNKKRILERY
jgi:hypothetical protein